MKKVTLLTIPLLFSLLIASGLLQTAAAQCLPRSNFYFGEITPDSVCGNWNEVTVFGPGEYFRTPLLAGGLYSFSTCGSGIDTQITGFEGTQTATSIWYNDDFGPDCPSSTQASFTYLSTFTDHVRVNVNEYNCLAGGSQSVTVKVRQMNNLAFTSSAAPMCAGDTLVLTATPAPVTTPAQPNSGDLGSFSGIGVVDSVFTAPVPASDTATSTLTYFFGYCSTDTAIEVYAPPSTANAGPDQTICGSTATLAATTPTTGQGP